DVGDREPAGLRGELRLEHDLEEKVAELVPDRGRLPALDRLEHLVDFLEQVGPQALRRLLAIPGTALRSPQARHDVDETRECVGCARIGHRATVSTGPGPVNAGLRRRAPPTSFSAWRTSRYTRRRAAPSASAPSGCSRRAASTTTRSTWPTIRPCVRISSGGPA